MSDFLKIIAVALAFFALIYFMSTLGFGYSLESV